MTARIEFFFSYRSPYSYLAAPRALALADRFDVDVVPRGVIPMIMRGQSVPRAKALHTLRDVAREADRLGMPFGRIHDPVGPGALRCLAVGEHAVDVGRIREFVVAAGRAIWGQAVDVASDRGLRGVCETAGLDWTACRAALDDPTLRERYEASTAALDALGHWGVPVLVLDGELYWGQDRIEDVEDALQRAGATR
jgi:2-hydroxychromene-2-carboxylate isomerase